MERKQIPGDTHHIWTAENRVDCNLNVDSVFQDLEKPLFLLPSLSLFFSLNNEWKYSSISYVSLYGFGVSWRRSQGPILTLLETSICFSANPRTVAKQRVKFVGQYSIHTNCAHNAWTWALHSLGPTLCGPLYVKVGNPIPSVYKVGETPHIIRFKNNKVNQGGPQNLNLKKRKRKKKELGYPHFRIWNFIFRSWQLGFPAFASEQKQTMVYT